MPKDIFDRLMTRREAVRVITAGAATIYLGGCATLFRKGTLDPKLFLDEDGSDFSPVDRSVTGGRSDDWTGEFPDARHSILWNKDGYLAQHGGVPAPTETVPLVIVGGGLSGLSSAYLLRKHKPIVLEQNARFGGNSKGESWNGVDYSIGAAYIVTPTPGGEHESFLREIGLADQLHVHEGGGQVELEGKLREGLWEGRTDPKHAGEIRKLGAYLSEYVNGGREFPDIPTRDPGHRKYIDGLDGESFLDHVRAKAGGELPSHVETAIEQYCWSSFGGSASEIGAGYGINFYSGEWEGTSVLPAGNASITEALVGKLARELPKGNLRPGSVVVHVEAGPEGALVAYLDPKGKLRSIRARAAILACPKFVVGRILKDIEPERAAAIRRLKYRSYLVANVLLNAPPKHSFYDLYLLGDGSVDVKDVRGTFARKRATDVILANFANPGKDRSVLTLYRAMPYDGARAEILVPGSFQRYRADFEAQVRETILPLLGYGPGDVAGMRVNRWGHPLPLAETGLIAGRVVDAVQKPFRDSVFFVEQDNWALPCFETAVSEAIHWSGVIGKTLG